MNPIEKFAEDFLRQFSRIEKNKVTGKFIHLKTPKVLVLGHGRHGKDEFANMLFESLEGSSKLAAEYIMVPAFINERNEHYDSTQECFDDRHNHRQFWHEQIKKYNFEGGLVDDGTRFARKVLQIQDCYVGMRAKEEFDACMLGEMFDVIFWVDRLEHVAPEPTTSMNIKYDSNIMVLIDNNGSLEQLKFQADYYKDFFRLFKK